MTFRIDSIRLQPAPGGWLLFVDFKGYCGAGIYAIAELKGGSNTLAITSTMDCSKQVTVPVEEPPTLDEHALRSWFASRLEELGWGPQLDQRNRPMNPTRRIVV